MIFMNFFRLLEKKKVVIDEMIILQHFKNAWVDGKWEEKFEYGMCDPKSTFRLLLLILIFKTINQSIINLVEYIMC